MNDIISKSSLKLGFSSCPNDTFIFEAIVNQRIDLKELTFDLTIADVEELNMLAMAGRLDVTKVSFAAYLGLVNDYVLLNAGSALGRGCGPLLISKEPLIGDIDSLSVAIPGVNTTANLLLGFAYPGLVHKKIMLFSEIEDAVLQGIVDMGLIIHESRFTYEQKGLVKVADLGEIWEQKTACPIPLGGIIAKRSLGTETLNLLSNMVRSSLEYAYRNPEEGKPYIKSLAQETDDEVIRQHIDLYVNQYSIALGNEGRKAVKRLFLYAQHSGFIKPVDVEIFLNDHQ